MLRAEFTSQFERDVNRLKKKHADLDLLKDGVRLVLADDAASLEEFRRRHRMHELKGAWRGAKECHVANPGRLVVRVAGL